MPDDAPRKRLTIADLPVSPRLAASSPRPPAGTVKTPFAIGQARPPQAPAKAVVRSPAPILPPKPAKATQPAPRPTAPTTKAKQPKVEPPPLDYVPPPVPQTVTLDPDGFPIGWCFERHSWGFHRSLWVAHGICLEFGEYSRIKRQCRPSGGGERLAHHVWRVTLDSGRTIVVGAYAQPVQVLSDEGWEAWVELQRVKDARYKARKAAKVEPPA